MPEQEATRRFLKLKELCLVTGMSPSTVERRLRDGSISCIQPGGSKTLRLFDLFALTRAVNAAATIFAASESAQRDTEPPQTRGTSAPVALQSPTNQRGPGPKWKRELGTLQICNRNPDSK